MKRATKPRYYPSRKGYYVQIDGRQRLLAKGDENNPDVVKRAWRRFRDLVPARSAQVTAITDEESQTLLKRVGTELGNAFRVIEALGCRPAEVCTLRAEDLDQQMRTLVINGRRLSLDDDIFALLTHLAQSEPPGPLLRTRHNRPWTVNALHRQFIRLRDRLGLRRELTLFALRHAFAIRFLEKGGSITDLAAILGISETQARKLYGR